MRDAATEFDDAKLTVTMIDINDHPPVFDPKYYEGTVNGQYFGHLISHTLMLQITAHHDRISKSQPITSK